MFERISRSWELVKASWEVLRQDSELLVFPLISALAGGVVIACFVLPILGAWGFDGMAAKLEGGMSIASMVVAFLFYVSLYFVGFFFNAALVGAALIRLNGGNPTVADGLRQARFRFWSILGYACIAATVGMVLRAIQERVGFIGRIIVGFLGAGWTVATFMVVPILVAREIDPVDAIKESAMLLKQTWGENVIGQAGLGLAFGFIHFAVIVGSIALVILAAVTQSMALVVIAVLVALIALAISALIHAALSGIYSAVLYRYATTGEMSGSFSGKTLGAAFAVK